MFRHSITTSLLFAFLAVAGCDCGGDGDRPSQDGGGPDAAALTRHPGPCTIEEDRDADGEPESLITLEYDALGQIVRRELDEGPDGEPDAVTVFTYDGERLLSIAEDMDASGSVDLITELVYEDGLLTAIELRDGAGELLGRTTLGYDERGNAVVEEIDDDADGSIDWRADYTYDAEDHLLREAIDEGADGELDRIVDHEWDGDLLARTTEDEGATGEANRQTTFHYDDLGQLVLEEIDLDADGTADTLVTQSYEGELLVLIERDVGADGTVDRRERFTHDEAGNVMTETIDRDGDDDPEEITRFGYDCF